MFKSDLERNINETLAAIADVLDRKGESTVSPEDSTSSPKESEVPRSFRLGEEMSPAEQSWALPANEGEGPLGKSLKELLNPMLREWVRENLSSLVTELLERELGREHSSAHSRLKIAPLVQSSKPKCGEDCESKGSLIGAMLLNRRMANRASKMPRQVQREEMQTSHGKVALLRMD
jgi:hypothetical protein